MNNIFKRKNKYEHKLDPQMADQMLQNVFESVGQKPNSVPFDKLILRKKIKVHEIMTMCAIAIISLLITFFSPLYFHFAAADLKQPEVVQNYVKDDLLWIVLDADSEGIDYDGCYAKDSDGSIIYPSFTDKKKRMIAFDASASSLNIFIPNYAGDVTHAVYTAK